ncbi:hypothetical protein ZIOFF_030766 [Zingiber officinale]|uniref:Zinc finger CCCH domain-containing protein 41 n=1 Tax=Zingiber officinale TaxID=94328 RepID=A0A8J5GYL7_ZINOF|nr:hypothetical protein ZIOFF_030766 [Zingiber officinale]
MSSESVNDTEDLEASDEDDDRNHKHRRREVQSISFDDDVQDLPMQRMNRRRSKLFDSRKNFHDSANNGNLENFSNFDKRRLSLPPLTPQFGSRGRINQTPQIDTFPNFDKSAPTGRPLVGRGRNIFSLSQQDSRFNPLDALDFPSQVVSQGLHTHASLFGTGIPSVVSAQNSSWGAFGFVNGINNRILDPLQPLGLQGALQPAITPWLNMGMPHQRCRDFDEQGYCLRGDICPMEHGVNRIVIEDVQSLSQFNLSLSDRNLHALGIQAGQRSLPSASAAPVPSASSSKLVPAKDGKLLLPEDSLKLNVVSSSSGFVEADVYDPDQPLWNNGCQGTSETTVMLSLENNDAPLWNVDSSTHSSVQDQIDHSSRSELGSKTINNAGTTNLLSDEIKVVNENSAVKASASVPEKQFNAEMSKKPMPQKASRTLYVHSIPQKDNTRDALLSHFQKFGVVVDIYIPQNSEKAFVQFLKREEAEAALKAPDAVMGNRFIKLWWANRDRALKGQKSFPPKVPPSSSIGVGYFPYRSFATEKEKEDLSSTLPHGSKLSTSEVVVSIPVPKSSANTSVITYTGKKKLDSLEALKEELRKKQENLALKRDEFRLQLEKFEKQAVLVKMDEETLEPTSKRLKKDLSNEGAKTEPSRALNIPEGAQEDINNTQEVRKLVDATASCTAKSNTTIMGNSSKEQTGHQHLSKLSTCSLDNQSTSFRVLPPLPAGLTNVDGLRDHFALFGDLSSVALEEPEEGRPNVGMKMPENFCACVTFSSCDSAERAYTMGTSVNSPGTQRNSADTAQSELMVYADEKSSLSVDDGHSHCNDGSVAPLMASHSKYGMLSCEKRQAMPGVQVKDKMDIGFAQESYGAFSSMQWITSDKVTDIVIKLSLVATYRSIFTLFPSALAADSVYVDSRTYIRKLPDSGDE